MHAIARPFATASLALAASGLIAVAPMAQPPEHHILSAAVRLADSSSLLGDLGNLGGLASDLGSFANIGGLADPGSLLNIPYNIFADIVNIPYYESLALQEYAYALGPAATVGGVPGWIPPGATLENGGVVGDLYALGGTGSWYMESIGNTWGWDDGNWPQLDAISHFLLPFQFTESWAEQVQTFAQAEFIDGAHIGCEFECANPLGYLGGWLHGQTSLASLLSGFQYPNELTDSVGANPASPLTPIFGFLGNVINIANPQVTGIPTPVGDAAGTGAIWSGQPGQLDPLTFLTALGSNLTQSPAGNPIQFPNIGDVFSNGLKLFEDTLGPNNNFDPIGVGSFLYWGAAKDYSIPSALGGTLQDFTGIPNQWGLANLGAEPPSGYGTTPLSLPGGLLQGLEYFLNGDGGAAGNGLLGYLNPETYLQALNTDIGILTNPNNLLASLPLVGFLGLGNNVPGAIAPGSLLGTFAPGYFSGPLDGLLSSFDLNGLLGSVGLNGLLSSFDPTGLLSSFDPTGLLSSFDPGSLLGALDPTALTTELSALLPNIGTDLAAMLGTNLAGDLTALLPNIGTDLAAMLGPELGSNLATTLGPDLALNFANLVPQLAMSFLGI